MHNAASRRAKYLWEFFYSRFKTVDLKFVWEGAL